jgi:cytochrome c553
MKPTTTSIAIVAVFAAFSADSLMSQEALPIRDCTWCHGSSAQGFANAPRLAGQKYQYLDNSLLSFKDHVRDNPYSKQYMWGAAANLNEEMSRSFALYFSQLPAEPANDGDWKLVNEGNAIYVEGIPESNVVSCIVCHGPKGEGFEGIPRLGGMSYAYLKRRLEQWKEGYDTAAEPMPRIARHLSQNGIEAIASYLSFIR